MRSEVLRAKHLMVQAFWNKMLGWQAVFISKALVSFETT